MRRRVACGLVALVLVALSACSGGGGTGTAAPGAGSKRGTPAPGRRKISGPGCRFIVAGTERRFTPITENLEYLTTATAEATTCYDKITFVFDRGDGPDLPPSYLVEYRKEPFGLQGIPTSTGGFKDARAVLYVEIKPTSASDQRRPGRAITTYKGNLRLQLKGMKHTVIVEYVSKVVDPTPVTDPSDDRIVWLIGLDEKLPFTVDAANQPPRVSVLIKH